MIQDGTGHIKIGVTRDVGKRLSGLRTGSSTGLVLIRFIEGAGPKIERWLHRRFKDQRVQGEWFRFIPEMLTVIPPDEAPAIPRIIQRRDVRLTLLERIRATDESADLMCLTAQQRLLVLIQQIGEDEAEALCEAIRNFAASKPGVVA